MLSGIIKQNQASYQYQSPISQPLLVSLSLDPEGLIWVTHKELLNNKIAAQK
jgi:hypothetical protein